MVEVLMIICLAIALGNAIAERFKLIAPLVLIVLGVLISYIPHVPYIGIDPHIALSVFLPLLLFWEAQNISLRGIKQALRGIILSGTLMVIFVAVSVGFVGQWVGLTLGTALLIGAAVGPTDATAVAALGKGISPRQMVVLRAESLINDGTALVVFALALEYASGEAEITAGYALWRFFVSFAGGALVGLAVGWVVTYIGRFTHSYMVANVLRIAVPLTSFFLAEHFEASGVLAVVVTGLYMAQRSPRVSTTQSRVLSRPVWGLTSYVLNSFLFLLVGLHLPTTVKGLSNDSLSHALFATVVLYLAMMAARWIFGETIIRVIRMLDRRPSQKLRRTTPQGRLVNTVAGFRGAISLAVAFSIPETLANGEPFPYRDVILFVTSGIVILSLVVQGALIPVVVRWSAANPNPAEAHHRSEEEELQEAYTVTYHKVMEQLPQLAREAGASPELEQKIREEWIHHFGQHSEQPETAAAASEELAVENDLRLRVIRASREQSILLRDQGVIDDEALIEMMDRYDIEEMRLVGPLHLE